jgi:hypothetical protein
LSADLIAKVHRHLDRHERIAMAATPGPWIVSDSEIIGVDTRTGMTVIEEVWRETDEGAVADAEHIVANDPARVLRGIAAHRSIVDAYEQACVLAEQHPDSGVAAGEMSGLGIAVSAILDTYAGGES